MPYSLSSKPGYIINYVDTDQKVKTYDVVEDGWLAVSIGEHLVQDYDVKQYWIIDRQTGKIEWERI
jgi:hypothetical protein